MYVCLFEHDNCSRVIEVQDFYSHDEDWFLSRKEKIAYFR